MKLTELMAELFNIQPSNWPAHLKVIILIGWRIWEAAVWLADKFESHPLIGWRILKATFWLAGVFKRHPSSDWLSYLRGILHLVGGRVREAFFWLAGYLKDILLIGWRIWEAAFWLAVIIWIERHPSDWLAYLRSLLLIGWRILKVAFWLAGVFERVFWLADVFERQPFDLLSIFTYDKGRHPRLPNRRSCLPDR